MITGIKFLGREGSWKHPEEWVFEVMRPCEKGCSVWYLGFFIIEFRHNACKGDKQ
jgi:hypothetical protein